MQNRMEIEVKKGVKLVCEKDDGELFNLFLEDVDSNPIQDLVSVGTNYIFQEVDGVVSVVPDEDFISVQVYTSEGSNMPDVEHMLQIIER